MPEGRWTPSRLALALLLVAAGAARGGPPTPAIEAEPWPAADALFHRDPHWRGGDAAYSVPLGNGRVLWLFGDTFVANGAAPGRRAARMVRNSIAIQQGLDPSTAAMTFRWRADSTGAASFFPEDGDRWYWPGHGIRIGRRLVLFLERVRETPGEGLGFRADGWRAALVGNPDADPGDWRITILPPPQGPGGVVVGIAVWREGRDVVALGIREPGDHAGILVRWPAAELARGQLRGARWWMGDSAGWVATDRVAGFPALVLDDAGPECSLHLDPRLGRRVHVRSVGFGATEIGVRLAPRAQGPWGPTTIAYRPPESDRRDVFVYAAKGHPELSGADLVVTYATNTFAGFDTLLADTTLYYPRFVRLRFTAAPR
jgi:hypothetical protein